MNAWMSFSAGALRLLALVATLGLSGLAGAGPGAHGPNGEHLDAPAAAAGASGGPRVEAHSEAFELVGRFDGQELSLLIDRYDSNEPVLGARVTVESGGIEAEASFHADQGDYAVRDERLLALLRQPGEHALVFTLALGNESDLLDGLLRHPATPAAAAHAEGAGRWGWAGAAAGLALAAVVSVYLRRRARARALPGLGEPA